MNFGKKLQYDFPKMRGGSKAVWNFSENSSVLEGVGFPKSDEETWSDQQKDYDNDKYM